MGTGREMRGQPRGHGLCAAIGELHAPVQHCQRIGWHVVRSQQQAMHRAGAAQPATAQADAEDARCTDARANLAILGSSRPVHEAGEDGKPGRALNDAERASQLELANAAVKAYCTSTGTPGT